MTEEKETRTIRGRVRNWTQNIGEQFGKKFRSVHIEEDETSPQYGHKIFIVEDILKVAEDNIPAGSEIEFIETRNGNYWNFKKESLKVLNLAKANKPQSSSSEAKEPVDWDAKDRRIVRQNVLRHSVALVVETMKMLDPEDIAVQLDKSQHQVLRLAEKFESWVYRTEKKETAQKTLIGQSDE